MGRKRVGINYNNGMGEGVCSFWRYMCQQWVWVRGVTKVLE